MARTEGIKGGKELQGTPILLGFLDPTPSVLLIVELGVFPRA